MKFRRSNVAIAAAMVLFPPLAGCAGNLDPGALSGAGGSTEPCVPNGGTTTPPATFATVRASLKGGGAIESCSSAPCHPLGGMAPPPPLIPLILQDDASLYSNMMSYVSVNCGNVPLVNPGKPNESGLVRILSGPCANTLQMPFGCTGEQCFATETIAAISQWIANCAPEN
jgi:hypothetical protein